MSNVRFRTAVGTLGMAACLALAGCSVGVQAPVEGSPEPVNTSFDFFAAASLTDVAPELIREYNATHDPDIDASLNFGASSKLVTQINGGEKPGMLVTADTKAITALERPDVFSREKDIATNHLVLVVPSDSKITTAEELVTAGSIAVCAPAVPCGRAANSYLDTRQDVNAQFTEEADVRSVLTKVTSGQVDAGFVYATDAASAGDTVRSIALTGVEPNVYPLLVNKDASSAVSDFAQWLHTDGAQAILKKAGFDTP